LAASGKQRLPKDFDIKAFDCIRAYNWFVNYNTLPNAGGWLDQPSFLIDAINIIDEEVKKKNGK